MRRNATLSYMLSALAEDQTHKQKHSLTNPRTLTGVCLLAALGFSVVYSTYKMWSDASFFEVLIWYAVSAIFLALAYFMRNFVLGIENQTSKLKTVSSAVQQLASDMSDDKRYILNGARVLGCKKTTIHDVPVLVVQLEHLGSYFEGIASVHDIRFNTFNNESYICDVSMYDGYIY